MNETNIKPKKGNKQAQLDAIAVQVKGCTLCPLWKSRSNAVPGVGDPNASIVIIGEGPGWHEDKQGLPFVGPSGQLLDKLLGLIGIKREDVFITNVVKCRPPNNRDPMPNEVATCHPYLAAQLDIIQPRIIVTLGRHSMSQFLPDAKITQVHGKPHRVGSYTLVPMFHPAAALRVPAWMTALNDDFKALPAILADPSSAGVVDVPIDNGSPAAEAVAEAMQEVAAGEPVTPHSTTVPSELVPDNAPTAAEDVVKPKMKRGNKTATAAPEPEVELVALVPAEAVAPDAEIAEVAPEPVAALIAPPTEDAASLPKPKRVRKSAAAEPIESAPAVSEAETSDAAWAELEGATASTQPAPRRGRPRKAEAEPTPAPNETDEPAPKPKPSSRREKEEEAGQMSLFLGMSDEA